MEDFAGRSYDQGMEEWRSMLPERTNVGDMERLFSALYGAALLAYGLTRGSFGGLAMTAIGGMLIHRGASGYCPVYEAIDVDSSAPRKETSVHILENLTIRRPRREIYESWRDFEKLPRFMRHIESVDKIDETHSHWRATLPKGIGTIEWESQVTEDRPDERIAWRSLPDADIRNAGEVTFRDAPGKRGTELNVHIQYRPPAGRIGQFAAGLANPAFSKMVREDIRRFKALMETGEIPTTEGQPAGGR